MPNAMTRTVREFLVFLASPGDVNKERDIVDKVIDEFNNTVANRQNATFRLLRWETDAYPTFHLDGPQGAIDEQLSIIDCAIFICIFWQRLGTPTKDGKSGTEHEFWIAYENWEKNGTPYIMLYRSDESVNIREIDLEQIKRLNEFFNNPKIKNNWVPNYQDSEHFEETFRSSFFKMAQDILDGKKSKPVRKELKDDDEMLQNLQFSKEDWKPITYNILKKYNFELPENEAIAFFEGLEPSWKESISPSIARRDVVQKIVDELTRTDLASPHIVFLHGLGGEGKSTALQQALYETLQKKPYTYVLWHQHTNTPFGIEIIKELAKTQYEWVIASDDADLIEKDLRKAVRHMRDNNIKNIQFLLTARETDWKAVKAEEFGWPKSANFIPISINLTEHDASMIVEKWGAYGEKGLGRLKNKTAKDAAQELFRKAQTEKTEKGLIDNSLLGAMLQVRTGKTVQEHLRPSLSNLEEIKAEGKEGDISLRKAIAYISALHAYNIKIVTREILADALGCSEEVLAEQIINPLGKEIIAGKFILIRHSSIAEAIKDILSQTYDFTQITKRLFRSAEILFLQRKNSKEELITKEEIGEWNKLPRDIFLEKGDKIIGLELAKEAVGIRLDTSGKFDSYCVIDLAYLYEKLKQKEMAVKVYREYYLDTKVSRAYYYAWGSIEGKSRHNYIGIWLSAISLSDGIYERKKDSDRLFISLSGLSETLKHAYKQENKSEFLNACYVASKLGLRSMPDEKAYINLKNNLQFTEQEGATTSKNEFQTLYEGIKLGCSYYEKNLGEMEIYGAFPEKNLPTFENLNFIWFESQFK